MSDPDRLVLVARVSGAFGVKGEVKIRAFTDNPLSLLDYKDLKGADGAAVLTLLGGRAFKDGLIARAREVADKTQADALRGLELYAPRSALPPPDEEGEFYLTDLIGLKAEAPDGVSLGRVKAVPNYGAGDLLEIAPDAGGASWLVAFTAENAPLVDIEAGRIVVVRPPETE